MKKGRVAWLVFLVVGVALGISYAPLKACAAETESEAALVEGAKKEGKLLIYESWNIQGYVPRMNAFKKKYPFINVENWRENGTKILIRSLAEARANRHVVDLFDIRGFEINLLKGQGMLMKYHSPNFQFIAPEFIDHDDYFWADDYAVQSVSYNTKAVSHNDAPKTHEDLLNPKWKGKMGMDENDYEWMGNLLMYMGKEKGMEFMKKLSKQNIQFRSGKRLLANLLAAGELQLFLTASGHTIEEYRENGAPVRWVPMNPTFGVYDAMGIAARAPHPNAAKLYTNFISSKEGQNIVSLTGGANPIIADGKHKYPNLDVKSQGYKLIFSSVTTDYDKVYGKDFRGLFMNR